MTGNSSKMKLSAQILRYKDRYGKAHAHGSSDHHPFPVEELAFGGYNRTLDCAPKPLNED